jgi:Protein of unknown function (DUF2846)
MKVRILTLALATTAALMTGCASVTPGDPARGAELKKFQPNPAVGQVYVCRGGSFLGAAITPTIELNGRAIASLSRNNFFYVELAPGDHTIIAKTPEHDSKFPFKIAAGEQVFFQTWITIGVLVGRGVIDTMSAEEGKKCVSEAALVAPLAASSK